MKQNQKLLNRLDGIYDELKKAERQIKRQAKAMGEEYQRVLSQDISRAKKAVESLYWEYVYFARWDKNE